MQEVKLLDKIIINDIEMTIHKKRIKNVYIRVKPPMGEVHISAPQRISLHQIKQFAKSKIDWIVAQREKCMKTIENQPTYSSGEYIPFQGRMVKLEIVNSKRRMVKIDQEKIIMHISENSTVDQKKKALDDWYRKMMLLEVPVLVEKWQKILGVRVSGVGIKNMKTRWGSCNVKTGKIWLNLRLIQKATQAMEYVVVHELVHLLEKSHNQVFKRYMDHFLPQWRTIRKELNSG